MQACSQHASWGLQAVMHLRAHHPHPLPLVLLPLVLLLLLLLLLLG